MILEFEEDPAKTRFKIITEQEEDLAFIGESIYIKMYR